ncbi:MAG: hypothetical protein DWB47_11300, partial [Gammaproteobacteria bacterium]|nr:hypothetical protein [Gammaproteobacteria bacterium]
MRMRSAGLAVVTALAAVAAGWVGTATAREMATAVQGSFNGSQENACIHVSIFFYLSDCSYARSHAAIAGQDLPHQHDMSRWSEMETRMAAIFKSKTRDEWCQIMEGTDVCFAPVLDMAEAPNHPHNAARKAFIVNRIGDAGFIVAMALTFSTFGAL